MYATETSPATRSDLKDSTAYHPKDNVLRIIRASPQADSIAPFTHEKIV
jgi:hypothetical protein